MTIARPAPTPLSCTPQSVAPSSHKQNATVTCHNTYALKVRGNSMCDSNLFDGDVVIIRRYQRDRQKETAVMTINQREIALKQLSINRLGVHLLPEDAATPAVFLHNGAIQVLGMVMGIAHNTVPPHH